jgi:hypothetical protein
MSVNQCLCQTDRVTRTRSLRHLLIELIGGLKSFVSTNRVVSALILAVGSIYLVFCALIGMPPVVIVGLPVVIVLIVVAWEWMRFKRSADPGSGWTTTGVALLIRLSVATMVVLVVAQAVPYGRDHANPPITGEPQWADSQTRELMVRACYSCHSNEVERPWYSNVAPISWMVQAHIDEGRSEVNYSEFITNRRGADETLEVILDGSMPPGYFTRFGLHSEAVLSKEELDRLIAGVRATPGLSENENRHGEDED